MKHGGELEIRMTVSTVQNVEISTNHIDLLFHSQTFGRSSSSPMRPHSFNLSHSHPQSSALVHLCPLSLLNSINIFLIESNLICDQLTFSLERFCPLHMTHSKLVQIVIVFVPYSLIPPAHIYFSSFLYIDMYI